jgi:small subunit ribosomal protein S16
MLTIRFARVGKKNKAQFKIMLQEHTAAPGGRHIEILGSYDPHQKKAVLKDERIKYWISKGANLSDTVHNLLVSKNIISDKKRLVKLPKKEVPAEPEATTEKAEEKKEEAAESTETKEEVKAEAAPEEKKAE